MTKRKRIMHCRLCDPPKASPSYTKTFKQQMAWLRRHRKKKHPTAHKKSVKKTQKTKREKGSYLTDLKKLDRLFLDRKISAKEYEKRRKKLQKKKGGNPCK